MTERELVVFLETFRSLARVFPRRGEADDLQQLGASYFTALRPYPLAQVQAGAEVCLQGSRYFPKPAEWIAAMPRSAPAADGPTLTRAEAETYADAERRSYEREPCRCAACVAAGVDWKPQRFVPEVTADDRDRTVRDPIRDRIVTAGHWAHGVELAGYYRAKGTFYAQYHAALGPATMATTTSHA